MKPAFIATPLLILALAGCSSSSSSIQSEQFYTMSGGQSVGETNSLYWYTERLEQPYSASDYVTLGKYGWYHSDYRWRDGVLKEVVREGEQLESEDGLVSFRVHLRFNANGEAVYQQYRLDGKVLPMLPDQIAHVQREANGIRSLVSRQDARGEKLYQGYWDGSKFTTCSGRKYKTLEFNQTLPTFVINRLAELDSYAAFVGRAGSSKLTVLDIFLLNDEDFDCLEPVSFIED